MDQNFRWPPAIKSLLDFFDKHTAREGIIDLPDNILLDCSLLDTCNGAVHYKHKKDHPSTGYVVTNIFAYVLRLRVEQAQER